MKRLFIPLLLVFLVCVVPVSCDRDKKEEAAAGETAAATDWHMPEVFIGDENLCRSSSYFSKSLALELLPYAASSGKTGTQTLLEREGFSVVAQKNYDKTSADQSHTCGFSIGKKVYSNKYVSEKALYLVCIQGTSGSGEWASNFDVSPSRSESPEYAENFLACAEDVYETLLPLLPDHTDFGGEPVIVVCGYSRGAAAANLLGILLDDSEDPAVWKDNVFVYTFATPMTVCGEKCGDRYPNVFNLVNPSDLVTMLPLSDWGFSRAGRDVMLSEIAGAGDAAASLLSVLKPLAPTLADYYGARHSLTSSGLSDGGMTAYELVPTVLDLLTGSANPMTLAKFMLMSPDSDLDPVRQLLTAELTNGGRLGKKVAAQHGDAVYLELITKLAE